MDNSLDIDHGRDLWQWPLMASHWSFPARYRGLMMVVRTTTNCERVELVCNDKQMGVYNTADFPNNTIEWNVPFNPGTIVANAYNGDSLVASSRLVTAYKAEAFAAKADRTSSRPTGKTCLS